MNRKIRSIFFNIHCRYFSSEPHFAGTQRSKDLADEIKKRWKSYGFHVETLAYKVLLPRAKDGRPDFMEIRDQKGNIVLKHDFAAVVSWHKKAWFSSSHSESSVSFRVVSLFFKTTGTSQAMEFSYIHTSAAERLLD